MEQTISFDKKTGNPAIGFLLFLLLVPVLLAAMSYWLLWDAKEYGVGLVSRMRRGVAEQKHQPGVTDMSRELESLGEVAAKPKICARFEPWHASERPRGEAGTRGSKGRKCKG